MNKTLNYCLGAIVCSFLVGGCATETTIVEGPDKLISAGLDTQNFAQKADEMVASLVDSSPCPLDKSAQHPAVIAIGNIINNTGLHIDTDLLMKKIRVQLNKNGKAITDTTGGALNTLDFTFSGKIIDTYTPVNGKRQHTYTFQLSLTDNRGLAVWEEEKEISKLTK